jgi:hypothetical protein
LHPGPSHTPNAESPNDRITGNVTTSSQ